MRGSICLEAAVALNDKPVSAGIALGF